MSLSKALTKADFIDAIKDLPDDALIFIGDMDGKQWEFELCVRTDDYQEAELLMPIYIEKYTVDEF